MDNIPYQTVKSISFGIYSTEEIKKLSVLEVTNVEILDCLGHPSPGGLYDLRLGPNEKDDFCATCGLNFFKCPGHPGHISLPVSVYNPVFFQHLYQILRGSCFYCHKLMANPIALHLTLYQLQALDYGLVSTVQDLAEVVTDTSNDIVSGQDVVTVVQSKLKRKFDEAVSGLSLLDKKSRVKSVVECRRNIFKAFVKDHMMRIVGKCPHCKMPRKKLSRHHFRFVFAETQKNVKVKEEDPIYISNEGENDDIVVSEVSNKELIPEDAKKHLHLLWKNDKVFLQNFYKTLYCEEQYEELSIDMFFMNAIIVPPSKFRRLNVMKGRKYADAQTVALNEVVKDSNLMRNLIKVVKQITIDDSEKDVVNKLPGKTNGEKFNFVYHLLQRHVNEIFDSETGKDKNKITKGIKQVLEKKEGLFRMNMMGKRVNYAARSVISPDPYIMVNEIGVPLVFAKKLTFPEPVSHWNAERLRLAVKNGPNVHPGACLVEYEDGKVVKLSPQEPGKRQAIANTLLTPQTSGSKYMGGVKIVHRHLRNGDMLLLNRQPTLHKPSIMAHKARVLPGEKTLRLHYANCKSYNADFDGDEMNAHFPQSFLGQSESRELVSVNHQYLVPKDGTPLSGLIQDHIIAGTLLTKRGSFFSKEDYHQLVYSAISFTPKRLKLLPPSILKPNVLWSGKQIVSTIIINLIPDGKPPPTLEGKAKVSSKNWKNMPARDWEAGGTLFKGDTMSESEVIIRSGELLCGVIDKAQVGPTPYSLIHVCYELYGGETSSIILTALARLFTHYLQYIAGFTLGIEDIVVTKKANKQRRKILRKAGKRGLTASAQALDVDDPSNPDLEDLLFKYKETHFSRDDFGLKMLDVEMKKVTHTLNNEINEVCIPNGLVKKFPLNNLQLMVESGAKGSSVNAMQISCLLGQIELEGRRMPLMLNGSTLPSFLAYDTSPGAGGFVGGRFLTGINPQEYFFHCMAGREGLIDTAVKTSRSGYLQRCLIKHLEGISVNYDLTVRDSDGTIIQFLYGEDGLNILKMQMLKENRLHLLAQNYNSAMNKSEVEALLRMQEDNPEKCKKKINKWKKKHPETHVRSSLVHSVTNQSDLRARLEEISAQKSEIDEVTLENYQRKISKCPDPISSKFRPDTAFGSVSEKLDAIISSYMKKNPHNLLLKESNIHGNLISTSQFQTLCHYQALKSLAEPGETVGLLAAQSIGEPSTQMTLNTFHFAGKGEMNVTLGIPRIREILMTASSNIATPTMDLPLLEKPGIEESADKLRLKLSPVLLKDVLERIEIKEFLSVPGGGRMNSRNYKIKCSFLKYSEYKGFVNTSPSKILYYVEHVFVKKVVDAMNKKMHLSSASKLIDIVKENHTQPKVEPSEEDIPVFNERAPTANEDESSGESDGDGDTTSAKSKMRHEQEQEYEDPEDEELVPETDEESAADDDEISIKEEVRSSDDDADKFNASKKCKSYHKNSISDQEKALRINAVKCVHSWVFDYNFDEQSERWCEIYFQLNLSCKKIDMKTLLEEEVNKALVYQIPQIKQAILVKNPDAKEGSKMMLKTNGVNFLEIFKYVDILDINKVYSNNIHEISKIYGIEAAANAIKKEIVNVFTPYGIQVDPRHLSLISDYMTSSGHYRPCNRIGMEGNASPLQQMTFETTKNFLVDAMLMGIEDKLKSPSANIVAGQLYGGGTGCFQMCCKTGS